MWVGHIFYIHSSADGHRGILHVLAVVTNAAMNPCVQVFVWICVFIPLGSIPRSGVAGSKVPLYSTTYGTAGLFPRWRQRFASSPAVYEASSCSTSLSALSNDLSLLTVAILVA